MGKKHTVAIERNNSNTRYYLGRFNRKTKIVSRSEYMVNLSLKLWWFLCEMNNFLHLPLPSEHCLAYLNTLRVYSIKNF